MLTTEQIKTPKERDMPKKVIEDFMCYCPNCKEQLITGQENYNYCMHCGQRLDWNIKGEKK